MKVTKEQIMKLEGGEVLTTTLNTFKECQSARQYAYQLSRSDPKKGVAGYSSRIKQNLDGSYTIHIMALVTKRPRKC